MYVQPSTIGLRILSNFAMSELAAPVTPPGHGNAQLENDLKCLMVFVVHIFVLSFQGRQVGQLRCFPVDFIYLSCSCLCSLVFICFTPVVMSYIFYQSSIGDPGEGPHVESPSWFARYF